MVQGEIFKIKGYTIRQDANPRYSQTAIYMAGRSSIFFDWTRPAPILDEIDITTYENVDIASQNPSKIVSRVITRKEPLIRRYVYIFENYKGSTAEGVYFLDKALPLLFVTEQVTTTYTYTQIFRNDIIVQAGQNLYEIKSIQETKEQLYFEKITDTISRNFYYIPRFIPEEKTFTSYEKQCQGRWTERKATWQNKGQSKTSSGYLYQTQNTVQDVYSIPDITYRPLPFPVIQRPLLATVGTGYAGISPFVQNRDFKSASTLTTKGELENYARMMGIIRWQRYYSYEIAAGYQTVNSYTPFQAVDAGDGRFIRDRFGVSLNYESGSWQFVEDCIGNLVGNIPTIAPPQLPYPPILQSSLNIGDVPAQNFTQGIPIESITFSAAGGIAPYTFSSITLPVGLSLSSSGILTGTATAIATTSVTVTVTDAIVSSVNTTFNIVVAAPVIPAIITTEPIPLTLELTFDCELSIKFFDLPIECGGNLALDGNVTVGERLYNLDYLTPSQLDTANLDTLIIY
jgi:hypothetical protein